MSAAFSTASYEAVTTVTTADPDAAICSAAVADGEQIEGTATGEENLTGDTSINTGGLDTSQSISVEPLYAASAFWTYLDDLLDAICKDGRTHGATREEQEDYLKTYRVSAWMTVDSHTVL